MTTITTMFRLGRGPLRLLARPGTIMATGAALLLGACDFDIPNTNAPTVEEVTGNPSRATLARVATGIFSNNLTDVGGDIQFYGIYGRELYNLQGNDPRETNEQIRGPLDPGGRGGGLWGAKYQAIRTINAYLAALENPTGLTQGEIRASRGFALTMKAHMFSRLAVRTGALGIPIAVDQPITADPAPFVSFADAMQYASDLYDEGLAELQAAGSAAFPFTVAPGFALFANPAEFAKYNRALAARQFAYRATFNACAACWQSALTALQQSFLTTSGLPASLGVGAYYGYSSAAGEPSNPVTENLTSLRYWSHPSIITGAQLKADNNPDNRLPNKLREAATPRVLNDLTGTHKPILYNINTPTSSTADLGADIAIIKNEELILLRAEANLGLGNRQLALDDINLVRINSGGLPQSPLTAASSNADILTELLYNRVYSMMWEHGVRWIDARRYNRLNTLPLDRPGDTVFDNMIIPAAECDARGMATPCEPPIGG